MLGVIGAASVDDLFSGIPVQVRQKKSSDLPKALSEPEMLPRSAQPSPERT